MGLVLAFEASPRPVSRPTAQRRAPAQGADILFFTGVRYERQDAPEASDPNQAPSPAETAYPAS